MSTKEPPTFIYEFPHAAMSVHYHPDDSPFKLEYVEQALAKQVNAIALDLQFRNADKNVVCNYDAETKESPTLAAVLEVILRTRGDAATLYDKGYQFFLVLEPKNDSSALLNGILEVLSRPAYKRQWSTAVNQADSARGITIVITGANRKALRTSGNPRLSNELFIVEGYAYPSVHNLAPEQAAFCWSSYEDGDAAGNINAQHQQGYNVRSWGAGDRKRSFAAGADSVNCKLDAIDGFGKMLLSQQLRGYTPSLAMRGTQVALVFRGPDSRYLYAALGAVGSGGLTFTRPVLVSWLLQDEPQGFEATVTFDQSGNLFTIYRSASGDDLLYVSGKFTRYDRYLTFRGAEYELTSGDKRRCRGPAVAMAPDGRIVVVYEGTADQTLWYVAGRLNQEGVLEGQEHSLSEGDARRGANPTIAIGADGTILVAYEGMADRKLWYVTGTLDAEGVIVGKEHCFSEGDDRRVYTPCATFAPDGRVLIVYRRTEEARLFYVYGTLDGTGKLGGQQYTLTVDDERRGYEPTAAFDRAGTVTILYRGASDEKLWYVHGTVDTKLGIVGVETRLETSFDRW